MLSDLEELYLSCRSPRARGHIKDALTAYRGGAYRAAIVSTWIAVVFDLVDKMYEMALTGDAEAKSQVSSFEAIQKSISDKSAEGYKRSIKFERDVLDTFFDRFAFFDSQQMLDMRRLREDRHRCAHPSYQEGDVVYEPTAELARLHLANSLKHVLIQPPIAGKSALDRIERSILSPSFPSNPDDAVKALEFAGLVRPKAQLIRSLVVKVISGFVLDKTEHTDRAQSLFAARALVNMYRAETESIFIDRVDKLMRDAEGPSIGRLFRVLRNFPEVSSALPEGAVIKLRTYADSLRGTARGVLIAIAQSIPQLIEWSNKSIARSNPDLLIAIIRYSQASVVIDRAEELFTTRDSWEETNKIWDQAVKPNLKLLTTSHIKDVLMAVAERRGDLLSSRALNDFTDQMLSGKYVCTTEEFKAMLKEMDLLSLLTS
tara:strand:- start:1327 stop:2619 length:1293 start_codon:yes stop_codon:yes gene_type:complete